MLGKPDPFNPYSFCHETPMTDALAALPARTLPFNIREILISINERGVLVEIPLQEDEQLYGFGLQTG